MHPFHSITRYRPTIGLVIVLLISVSSLIGVLIQVHTDMDRELSIQGYNTVCLFSHPSR